MGERMKAPKEVRRKMNKLRRKYGKGNGVIPAALLDIPELERKAANSKRAPSRDGMSHHRVTPGGKAMGRISAGLAEFGRQRIEAAGLAGVSVPTVRDKMCASCACKRGTVPNGCPQTQIDFMKSVVEGVPFLCHAPMDGRMCAGWLRVRAEIVANPLPENVHAILARWEYSPPDDVSEPEMERESDV